MHIDVPTLYCLTIGTLCVAVAMTLWERMASPRRAVQLDIWAAGFAVLAVGCTIMMNRSVFPAAIGQGVTNVVFILGYLLLLHGTIRLDGRGRPLLLVLPVAAVALAWILFGRRYGDAFWNYGSALPIALISFATAGVLARSRTVRDLRSRGLAIAVSLIHGTFYLVRFAVMPLVAAVYGPEVLVVSAKTTMFEAVLFSMAMPMAFLALVREEAERQLHAASQTDHLTGLGNRHALFEHAPRLLATGRAGTLLAFDLDHFKAINDNHGHAVGDEVLKLFAGLVRSAFGPNAVLARIGGEEFAALLPDTDADTARTLAETLSRAFTLEAARTGGLALRATVSVGIAELGPETPDLAHLLKAADKALYRAKSLGRDRVEVADPALLAKAA